MEEGQVIGQASKQSCMKIEMDRKRQNGSVSTMLPVSRRPRALHGLKPPRHTPSWDPGVPALISHHFPLFLSFIIYQFLPFLPLPLSIPLFQTSPASLVPRYCLLFIQWFSWIFLFLLHLLLRMIFFYNFLVNSPLLLCRMWIFHVHSCDLLCRKGFVYQALSFTLFIWKLERVSGFKLFASIVEIYSWRVL